MLPAALLQQVGEVLGLLGAHRLQVGEQEGQVFVTLLEEPDVVGDRDEVGVGLGLCVGELLVERILQGLERALVLCGFLEVRTDARHLHIAELRVEGAHIHRQLGGGVGDALGLDRVLFVLDQLLQVQARGAHHLGDLVDRADHLVDRRHASQHTLSGRCQAGLDVFAAFDVGLCVREVLVGLRRLAQALCERCGRGAELVEVGLDHHIAGDIHLDGRQPGDCSGADELGRLLLVLVVGQVFGELLPAGDQRRAALGLAGVPAVAAALFGAVRCGEQDALDAQHQDLLLQLPVPLRAGLAIADHHLDQRLVEQLVLEGAVAHHGHAIRAGQELQALVLDRCGDRVKVAAADQLGCDGAVLGLGGVTAVVQALLLGRWLFDDAQGLLLEQVVAADVAAAHHGRRLAGGEVLGAQLTPLGRALLEVVDDHDASWGMGLMALSFCFCASVIGSEELSTNATMVWASRLPVRISSAQLSKFWSKLVSL